MRLTLHLQKHGFVSTSKQYIFKQLRKVSETEANKCHAFVNAFPVNGKNFQTVLQTKNTKIFTINK